MPLTGGVLPESSKGFFKHCVVDTFAFGRKTEACNRIGAVRCPWGIRWLIGHSIEDVTPEEMQKRWDAMVGAK